MTTVLCVDDNTALAEVLSELLLSMKFDPHTVPGGTECLASLKRGEVKPDIILLDIMMEPVDGWETLRNIRNDPDLFTIPVVMLTGKYPRMEEVDEFSSLIDGYLMKPFAIETVFHEMGVVLDRVRRREDFIDRARRGGADEHSLQEYRRFSSCANALKQFQRIMGNGTFRKDSLIIAEEQLSALERRLMDLGAAVS